jgi:threonine dehydrogenase-like Zn-dependent dehydrogenase
VRALTFEEGIAKLQEDMPEPTRGPQQAIVRPVVMGICDTDLQIMQGYSGFSGVLGHEFVGVVVDGPQEWMGQRVVADINFACGACPTCLAGDVHHCPQRTVMGIVQAHGAFAERVAVPVSNLLRVPDHVSDQDAVFTEPLAAAFEILEQVNIDDSMTTLVIGDGKLGSLCAQVLATTGATVVLWGHHQHKIDRIAKRGIQGALEPTWTGRPFDVVVEATGSKAGLQAAINAVRPRGTVVLKSTVAGAHELSLAPIVIDELRLVGSRCGPFDKALAALSDGDIDVASLIDAVYPLSDGLKALDHARRSGVMKVLLRC